MSLRAPEWKALLDGAPKLSTATPELIHNEVAKQEAHTRLKSPNMMSREAWRYTSLRSLRDQTLCPTHERGFDINLSDQTQVQVLSISALKLASQHHDLASRAWQWIEQEQSRTLPMFDLHRLYHSEDDAQVLLVSKNQVGGTASVRFALESASASNENSNDQNSISVSAPALWVYLDQEASLILDERYHAEDTLTLGITGIYISKGASLTHTRAQLEARGTESGSIHLSHLGVQVDGEGSYQLTLLNLGARESRIELDVSLNAPQASALLSGLYVGTKDTALDQHLTLRHQAPRCHSEQRFRGVLGDASKGTFTGRVIVAEGASQTRADQHNPNLLLSEDARAVTRPQLEIYNDDVECSHGATVGQLDADALFYLRARGLSEAVALQALTAAFVGEVRERVSDSVLLNAIDQTLLSALGVDDVSQASELWIDWEALESTDELEGN